MKALGDLFRAQYPKRARADAERHAGPLVEDVIGSLPYLPAETICNILSMLSDGNVDLKASLLRVCQNCKRSPGRKMSDFNPTDNDSTDVNSTESGSDSIDGDSHPGFMPPRSVSASAFVPSERYVASAERYMSAMKRRLF